MQDLQYLLMLQHTEEPIKEDLESYRGGLCAVEEQAGNVKDNIGLDDFHLHPKLVHVAVSQFVHGCNEETELVKQTISVQTDGRN